MSGHTSGPWSFRVRNGMRAIKLKRKHWEVGQHNGFGTAIVFGDNDANARLIASAPDMLAALKAAITLADANLPGFEERAPECQAVYDQCAAAIAKAEIS